MPARDTDAARETRFAPHFVQLCATLSLVGFAAMLVSNIVGSLMVPGHDPVADTISDLAAGRYEIIQDVGFYAYAAALLALALGLAHDHPGSRRWTAAILALAVMAALTVVIGARNEYGDSDSDGVVIHIYLVYVLALLLLAAPVLLTSDLRRWGRGYWLAAWGFAGLWLVAAPVFFLLPTGIDGAWERGLGLLATAWLAMLSLGLWRRAARG